jgi:hypothetical protein
MSMDLILELIRCRQQRVFPSLEFDQFVIVLFDLPLDSLLFFRFLAYLGRFWGRMVEFRLVKIDRSQILDALLKRFVLVLEGYGATILTCDLGGCATTEFFNVRSDFGGDVFAGVVDVFLRD